jgi:hypothetical protein
MLVRSVVDAYLAQVLPASAARFWVTLSLWCYPPNAAGIEAF